MPDRDIFTRIAAEQGWTAGTQVEVLLRYIANQSSPDVFGDFLAEASTEENAQGGQETNESFLWDVANALQHSGLAHSADFQEVCGNAEDRLTVEQAVESWRDRTSGHRC